MEGIEKAVRIKKYLALILSAIGYISLQYIVEITNAALVIFIYLLLFIPYIYFILYKNASFGQIVLFGVILRSTFLFNSPKLSDDFYRYYWDGTLLSKGLNPYNQKPTADLNIEYFSKENQHVYKALNSQNYYTVYPPVLQLIFALCAKFGKGVYEFALLFKILIILFEILTAFLIRKILSLQKKDVKNLAVYFLNPLIIVELTSNVHGEVVMVLCIALSLWAFYSNKFILLGIFLSLAFATKLYPILFIPIFLVELKGKSALIVITSFLTSSLVLTLPFIGYTQWVNILSSLSLYYQNFEFNGGFYYLLREIGFQLSGYNEIAIIGKLLAIVSFLGFLLIYLVKIVKNGAFSVELALFFIVFILYYFSTTVMPWYLAVLIFTSCFCNLKTGIIWSFLIVLSYSALANPAFKENLYLVLIEYTLISISMLYELFKHPKITQSAID